MPLGAEHTVLPSASSGDAHSRTAAITLPCFEGASWTAKSCALQVTVPFLKAQMPSTTNLGDARTAREHPISHGQVYFSLLLLDSSTDMKEFCPLSED